MIFGRAVMAGALALALAACAGPTAPRERAAPPPDGLPATATGVAAPSQAAPDAPQAGEVDPQPGGELLGPDGTVWVKPGMTSERYRADADDCYNFAQGRAAHDARIERDSSAAFESSAEGLGLQDLQERMTRFEREQSLPRLFGDCMESKGYIRG